MSDAMVDAPLVRGEVLGDDRDDERPENRRDEPPDQTAAIRSPFAPKSLAEPREAVSDTAGQGTTAP
jgi:hypothetical protein